MTQITENYLNSVKDSIDQLMQNEQFEKNLSEVVNALKTIIDKNGRLHMTGVGKCSYVAGYGSSIISSIGIETYYLDTVEAIHGSLGQVGKNDVIVAISNSGKTEELLKTVLAAKNNDIYTIAITGNEDSWLYKNCDTSIAYKLVSEGGPLNKVPRNSVNLQMITIQLISIMLQEFYGLTLNEYIKYHPGGTLGQQSKKELAND